MKTGEKIKKNLRDVMALMTTKMSESAERMITSDLGKDRITR